MTTNHELFTRAQARLPGGVNSPVRAFRAVGGEPFFTRRADGAYLWDVEGKRYIDYVGSWGPMIVGHNHPFVREAVERAVKDGLSFGTPCEAEVTMAETIAELIPSIDVVRMVNSGTEATMSAIRLAPGAASAANCRVPPMSSADPRAPAISSRPSCSARTGRTASMSC